MKEKVKQFLANGRGAILAILILELILTMFITPNKYDDAKFLSWLEVDTISNILVNRYNTWTSRVIIDFTVFSMLKISKYAWIITQAVMMALLGYSISKLFIKENKNKMNAMMVFMILAYPIDIMAEAGWAASTANYIWPLATALFALIPIKKVWNAEKFKWFQYILFMLAIIYACNQEQTCAIVLGTYILFDILFIIKDKKIHPIIVIQTLLSIISLIFIFTTPGNFIRQNTEIIMNFPNFEMLTLLDKISLGITSTVGIIIKKGSIAFGILSLMIAVYILSNYKEKIYRIIALIPIITICVLSYFKNITFAIFPFLKSFVGTLTENKVILTSANCSNLVFVIPIVFSMVILICLVLSILLIFKNLKNNTAILVFLVGLASRLIMGFSPTIFASGSRTIIFFEFAMIIASILIWQELVKKNDKNDIKIQNRTQAIIQCIAVVQYFNILLCILYTQK